MVSATYLDPSAHNYAGGWPVPPKLFDTTIGQQTYENFLEWAALADEPVSTG